LGTVFILAVAATVTHDDWLYGMAVVGGLAYLALRVLRLVAPLLAKRWVQELNDNQIVKQSPKGMRSFTTPTGRLRLQLEGG
jgi:hypothetical protein